MHFRHYTTCVEVERVRWVEWQQDKLLALGQARIFSPEVEWPAFLLIQVVEPPSAEEALCYTLDHGAARTDRENQETSSG